MKSRELAGRLVSRDEGSHEVELLRKGFRFGPLYLCVFLDSLGVMLLTPVGPFIAIELNATAQDITYVAAIYSLMQTFGTPILGAISDQIGRRRVLLVCLLAAAVALVGTSFCREWWQMLIFRALHGAFASTVGICEAIIADRSPPETRAQNISRVMGFFALGMLVAPSFGGGLVTQIGWRLLCVLGGSICFANWVWAWVQLPQELDEVRSGVVAEDGTLSYSPADGGQSPARGSATPASFVSASHPQAQQQPGSYNRTLLRVVTQPRAIILFISAFLSTIFMGIWGGVGVIFNYHKYGWNGFENGLAMTTAALSFGFCQFFIVGPAVQRFGEAGCVALGNITRVAVNLAVAYIDEPVVPWLQSFIAAASSAWIDPCMVSMLSGLSTSRFRGGVLGIYQGLRALGETAGPVVAGYLYMRSPRYPWLLGAALSAVAAMIPRRIAPPISWMRKQLTVGYWHQLGLIIVALTFCSGFTPGSFMWVQILADVGVFRSRCSAGENYCTEQYIALVLSFCIGSGLSALGYVPAVRLFDRCGGRVLAVSGALLGLVALALLDIAILGAARGKEPYSAYAVAAAAAVADAGGILASTALQAILWHFDGYRNVIESLFHTARHLSVLTPLFVHAATHRVGVPVPVAVALVGVPMLVSAVLLRLCTPLHDGYHEKATEVLGLVLPRCQEARVRTWTMLQAAWRVLQIHCGSHIFFVAAMALSSCWVAVYYSFAGLYAFQLFGVERSRDKAVHQLATIVAGVGSCSAAVAAMLRDIYGLLPFMVAICVVQFAAVATIDDASWSSQVYASICGTMLLSAPRVVIGSYTLAHAPSNHIGAAHGLITLVHKFLGIFLQLVALLVVARTPPGSTFAATLRDLVGVGCVGSVLCMLYLAIVGLPTTPVRLRRDEEDLCRSYGCVHAGEVLYVTGLQDREFVCKMLGNADPDVHAALLMSMNPDRLYEKLQDRTDDELLLMLRQGLAWHRFDETGRPGNSLAMASFQQVSAGLSVCPELWSRFEGLSASNFVTATEKAGGSSIFVPEDELTGVSLGMRVRVTWDVCLLGRECKAVGLSWPYGPTGNLQAKKAGLEGIVVQVRASDRVVQLSDGIDWVPLAALSGFEQQQSSLPMMEECTMDLAKVAAAMAAQPPMWATESDESLVEAGRKMNAEMSSSSTLSASMEERLKEPASLPMLEEESDADEDMQDEVWVEDAREATLVQAQTIREVTAAVSRSCAARPFSKALVRLLRSGDRHGLLQWLVTEAPEDIFEAVVDVETWLEAEALALFQVFHNVVRRGDLQDLLQDRPQLKQVIVFLLKTELQIVQANWVRDNISWR